MKRILKHPAVNAVCISLFTAFYALVFIVSSGHSRIAPCLYADYENLTLAEGSFLASWSRFLAAGHQRYIAYAMIAITLLLVVLLLSRRRTYDEYHVERLTTCLVIAMFLTLVAIALLYLLTLYYPSGIVEKLAFFIVIHWATVVLADLIYVLVCRGK